METSRSLIHRSNVAPGGAPSCKGFGRTRLPFSAVRRLLSLVATTNRAISAPREGARVLERCPESISPRNDTAGMTPRNRPHEIGLPREVERNLEPVAVGGARRPQRCRSSSTTRSAGEFGVSAKPATMSTSLVCGTPARSKTRSRRPVAPFRRHLRRAGPAAGRLRGRLD